MTVSELIELLQECDPDAQVRIAMQPSWPLQTYCGQVVEAHDCKDCDRNEDGLALTECSKCGGDGGRSTELECSWCQGDGMEECTHGDATARVYISAGSQCDDSPYLPSDAAQQLGWR